MKKVFKQLFFSVVCMMALATIASCDNVSNSTGNGTPGGGGITPAGYVDLGLPSGTKWKAANETNPNDENNFYTYDEAMAAFGNKLPTNDQFMELRSSCDWTWTGMGYKVVGSNGNSIVLPAAGDRVCDGGVDGVGSYGSYWLSAPYSSEDAFHILFTSGAVYLYHGNRCDGQSVRLVLN